MILERPQSKLQLISAITKSDGSRRMFSRLGKMEGKNRWDFLYTHPTSEKRIKVSVSCSLFFDLHSEHVP